MEKKINNKPASPEKHFAKAISLYFSFHKNFYKDEDGYALAPNWDGPKRGMEMRSLKLLLIDLRKIAEGKGFEWNEEKMTADFSNFLEKAYEHRLVRNNYLCCMMNRFKFDILSSSYNPAIAKKIRERWYFKNPDYTVDVDKDREASEIIVGFLKQQIILSGKEFNEAITLSSAEVIFNFVKDDPFWSKKSLKSISNNLQELVNKIKSRRNGQPVDKKTAGIELAINKALGRE